jgi:hypothetical protein
MSTCCMTFYVINSLDLTNVDTDISVGPSFLNSLASPHQALAEAIDEIALALR